MEITTILFITFTLVAIVIINLSCIAARDPQNSDNTINHIPFESN